MSRAAAVLGRPGTTTVAVGVGAALLTSMWSWVPSYWNDEAATLRLARLPLADFVAFVQQKDAVHAVYALVVHVWIACLGESEAAVRAPSAIATGFAAAGVLVLVRELGHPRSALVAAVVFVLLPRVVTNGVEARSYALSTALVTWAAVWAVRAARDRGAARWAVWAVLTALAVATFVYSLLVVPAMVLLAIRTGHGRRVLAPLVTSLVAAGLLAAPVVLLAAGQRGQVGWLRDQPVNAWTVLVEPVAGEAWWVAALLVALVVTTAVRLRREPVVDRRGVVALAVWIVLPTVVLVAASVVVTPVFTPRYLSPVLPAVAVVVGLCVTRWRPRTATALTVALVVAAVPSFVAARGPVSKPAGVDLRGLSRLVHDHARAGDSVLLGDSGTVSARPRIAIAAYPAAFDGLDDVAFRGSYSTTGTYSDRLVRGAALTDRLRDVDRVWVAVPTAGDRSLARSVAAAGLTADRSYGYVGGRLTLWERR